MSRMFNAKRSVSDSDCALTDSTHGDDHPVFFDSWGGQSTQSRSARHEQLQVCY